MQTRVTGPTQEVTITLDGPTVLIGERINPSGKKKLADSLREGKLDLVLEEAHGQVAAGADILDVNVGANGVDEIDMLPKAIEAIAGEVDVPLCIDSGKVEALEAALRVCPGRPIVNSVTGEGASLERVLPLVKKYEVPVIGLCLDDTGIPKDVEGRVAIARRIVERAEQLGIRREDIIIDCLTMTLGADSNAGVVTLDAVRRVKEEFGVNQTQGASNISHGLPLRAVLNAAYLAMGIEAGLTCPTVDAAQVRSAIRSADLILGRDDYALRYIRNYRETAAADGA